MVETREPFCGADGWVGEICFGLWPDVLFPEDCFRLGLAWNILIECLIYTYNFILTPEVLN